MPPGRSGIRVPARPPDNISEEVASGLQPEPWVGQIFDRHPAKDVKIRFLFAHRQAARDHFAHHNVRMRQIHTSVRAKVFRVSPGVLEPPGAHLHQEDF